MTHSLDALRKKDLIVDDTDVLRPYCTITLALHFVVDDASNPIVTLEQFTNQLCANPSAHAEQCDANRHLAMRRSVDKRCTAGQQWATGLAVGRTVRESKPCGNAEDFTSCTAPDQKITATRWMMAEVRRRWTSLEKQRNDCLHELPGRLRRKFHNIGVRWRHIARENITHEFACRD